jgi:trk system potassium uptake protein TrkH
MFALEFDGALAELPLHRKIFASLFFSVTARTAGFNTLDMAELTNATLFFTVILMAIGAGPCSTAGGFKVSTLMVLVLRAWSTFRGRVNINIARRTLPREVVDRATATAMLFAALGLAALTSLLVLEQSTLPHAGSQGIFLDALFEVTSALGTVGLSTGLTDRLTEGGQAIIILLMFAGRLGPISVAVALSRRERRVPIEFPQEEPLIG